jgi:hypothetical protein
VPQVGLTNGVCCNKEERAQLFKAAEVTALPRDGKAFGEPAGHFFGIVSVEALAIRRPQPLEGA